MENVFDPLLDLANAAEMKSTIEEEANETPSHIIKGPLSIQDLKTKKWVVYEFEVDLQKKLFVSEAAGVRVDLSEPFEVHKKKTMWPGFELHVGNGVTTFHAESDQELTEWLELLIVAKHSHV
eukprot:TRINITY_DN27519_c0_g1_i1.p2 TRINITY_DN27519_c0_g1~~TRINITY_DN27519_c0_g1_i1.p2  ORF type:complete len:143 (-),score=38.51 TRINITY_DN27519_c0_g1_i1:198-566(-)